MKQFDHAVTLDTPGIQNAPRIPLPLARRIVLHWVVRLLITWFGFGLMTAATVAGLQALSVDISPIVSVGLLAVCAVLAVVAVTRLIERRKLADIGLGVRRFVIDWLKGAGVGAAYLCASVGILAVLGGYRMSGVAFAGQALASGLLLHVFVGVAEEPVLMRPCVALFVVANTPFHHRPHGKGLACGSRQTQPVSFNAEPTARRPSSGSGARASSKTGARRSARVGANRFRPAA